MGWGPMKPREFILTMVLTAVWVGMFGWYRDFIGWYCGGSRFFATSGCNIT